MQTQIGPVELRGDEQLVHHELQPLRLVLDHLEELLVDFLRQLVVALAQRPHRAVHGGERRPKLVRRGRDEVGAKLFEPMIVGHVTEDDDAAAVEWRLGARQPALATFKRHRPRPRTLAGAVELDEDMREGSRLAAASDEAEERTRRRIPVPNDTGLVEQNHGLADVRERARCVGALLGRPARHPLLAIQPIQPLRHDEQQRDGNRNRNESCGAEDGERRRKRVVLLTVRALDHRRRRR